MPNGLQKSFPMALLRANIQQTTRGKHRMLVFIKTPFSVAPYSTATTYLACYTHSNRAIGAVSLARLPNEIMRV